MSRFSCYGVVDPNDPEAAGICDRGGEVRKRRELQPELAYRGDRLVETGFLVCDHHRDVPQPQDRARHLPADPVPIRQPRPDYDFQQPLALAAGVLEGIGIIDGGTTPEGAAFPGLGIIDPTALDEVWYTPRGGPSSAPVAPGVSAAVVPSIPDAPVGYLLGADGAPLLGADGAPLIQ